MWIWKLFALTRKWSPLVDCFNFKGFNEICSFSMYFRTRNFVETVVFGQIETLLTDEVVPLFCQSGPWCILPYFSFYFICKYWIQRKVLQVTSCVSPTEFCPFPWRLGDDFYQVASAADLLRSQSAALPASPHPSLQMPAASPPSSLGRF